MVLPHFCILPNIGLLEGSLPQFLVAVCRVTYTVNRNINYTNRCIYACQFCAFSKGKIAEDLRGPSYLLSMAEVTRRTAEAWDRGATEVCMQGGIHPDFTGTCRKYVQVQQLHLNSTQQDLSSTNSCSGAEVVSCRALKTLCARHTRPSHYGKHLEQGHAEALPDTGDTYLRILEAAKAGAADIHVHAFSPLEVSQGAATLGSPVSSYLASLRSAGLGSLPGTAAEVLIRFCLQPALTKIGLLPPTWSFWGGWALALHPALLKKHQSDRIYMLTALMVLPLLWLQRGPHQLSAALSCPT